MVTDEMVERYLTAQRAYIEQEDSRLGKHRPNAGGLHADIVREACRAGLTAATACCRCEGDGVINVKRGEGSDSVEERPCPDCAPATAADYDALRAEVDDLTHEREILRRDLAGWRETNECTARGIDSLRARAEVAEAKLAKLADAARDASGWFPHGPWFTDAPCAAIDRLRAALNEVK